MGPWETSPAQAIDLHGGSTTTRWTLTFDCHFEVPEDEWGDGASLEDPQGVLPSIGFLKVPEPKTAKNRLHLDLQVAGGRHVDQEKREELIEGMVDLLVEADGTSDVRAVSCEGAAGETP